MDETTPFRPPPHCCRAGRLADRIALGRCLHPAPLPDPLAKRQGAAAVPDRRHPRLRHANRPRCPPRLPRRGHRLSARQAQNAQDDSHRLAQPELFAWAGDEPLRLLPNARGGGKEALACYGLLRADTGAMLLRFVEGRPVSQVTEDYLGWLCQRFAREGKKVFVLVWDNASWHVSKRVRRWIGAHNRKVKRQGGCKIRVCYLPVKAPWLNPIEPKWLHGKRAIVEPERKLTPAEVKQRVHEHFRCEPHEPLTQNAA